MTRTDTTRSMRAHFRGNVLDMALALGIMPGHRGFGGHCRDLKAALASQVWLAGIDLGMPVVDDLGDLHELDNWRDTVEICHPVPEFLGEEAIRCRLRVPEVEVRCPLTPLIQGKDLEAYAKLPLKMIKQVCDLR